jgi:hypothetical protein
MPKFLTKLKCDSYLTLPATSSGFSPGVAFSGMKKAYIERHRDPSKVLNLHPVFEGLLKGIMAS